MAFTNLWMSWSVSSIPSVIMSVRQHVIVLTACGIYFCCVLQSPQWSAQKLKNTWHLWTPLWRYSARLTAPLPPLSRGTKTGSRSVSQSASGYSVQDPCRSPSSSQVTLDDTLALLPMQQAPSASRWASLYRVSSVYATSLNITYYVCGYTDFHRHINIKEPLPSIVC